MLASNVQDRFGYSPGQKDNISLGEKGSTCMFPTEGDWCLTRNALLWYSLWRVPVPTGSLFVTEIKEAVERNANTLGSCYQGKGKKKKTLSKSISYSFSHEIIKE